MKKYFNKINYNLSNAKTLIRYFPIVLKQGSGIKVRDINDKIYIDGISAAGSLPLGHNHPIIKDALHEFASKEYPVQTMDIPTMLQFDFLDKLYDFLPNSFSKNAKIQMCSPSGSDAVEAAIKLAKIATGRNTILSFYGGYHGQSFASSSISGKVRGQLPYSGMNDVHFLPYPDTLNKNPDISIGDYIQKIIENPQTGISKPAGIIFESVQGEGGVNIAPITWLKELRKITRDLDIPLIADEVQTGFCRTGRKFGFEHADIIPDMICLAKAIGGSMPLAALLHSDTLNKWTEYQHAGTWRGNQLALLTGTRCIEYMEKEKLWINATIIGERFINNMTNIKNQYSIIGDIRGKGLMLAIEIINEELEPDSKTAITLQQIFRENGLLVLRGGGHGHIIRMVPPLITTYNEMDEICDIIIKSIQQFYQTS